MMDKRLYRTKRNVFKVVNSSDPDFGEDWPVIPVGSDANGAEIWICTDGIRASEYGALVGGPDEMGALVARLLN